MIWGLETGRGDAVFRPDGSKASDWRELQKRAMTRDFSWEAAAQKYVELYRKALLFHRQDLTGESRGMGGG